jgi:hypothetical protein
MRPYWAFATGAVRAATSKTANKEEDFGAFMIISSLGFMSPQDCYAGLHERKKSPRQGMGLPGTSSHAARHEQSECVAAGQSENQKLIHNLRRNELAKMNLSRNAASCLNPRS